MSKPLNRTIQPVPMNLFPTLGSLEEVIALANSKIPIGNKNEVYSLLMTYHNSLLNVIAQEKQHGT